MKRILITVATTFLLFSCSKEDDKIVEEEVIIPVNEKFADKILNEDGSTYLTFAYNQNKQISRLDFGDNTLINFNYSNAKMQSLDIITSEILLFTTFTYDNNGRINKFTRESGNEMQEYEVTYEPLSNAYSYFEVDEPEPIIIYLNEEEDLKRINFSDIDIVFVYDSNFKGPLYNTNNLSLPFTFANLYFGIEFRYLSHYPLITFAATGNNTGVYTNEYDEQGFLTKYTRNNESNSSNTFIYKQL